MNSGATWQSPAHKPGRMALKWEWPRSEQFNIDPDVVGLEALRPTLGGGDIKWGYSVRKGSTNLCCLSSPLQTNVLRFVDQNGIHTSQPSWDKAVFPGPESLKAMLGYKWHPCPKSPTIPATSFQNLRHLFSEHGYTHNSLVQMHTL